jgi:hypothetical protein
MSFFQQKQRAAAGNRTLPKFFNHVYILLHCQASGERDTYVGSLLGIGTGLGTGLALGRTSNIPPTATPPLGGPLNRKLT